MGFFSISPSTERSSLWWGCASPNLNKSSSQRILPNLIPGAEILFCSALCHEEWVLPAASAAPTWRGPVLGAPPHLDSLNVNPQSEFRLILKQRKAHQLCHSQTEILNQSLPWSSWKISKDWEKEQGAVGPSWLSD